MRVLLTILIAAPALLVAWGIGHYGVDIPFYDEWHEAPLIVKFHENSLSWSDVWDKYNNHRVFFYRLISLPLSKITGWDTLSECWGSWILGLAAFFLMVWWISPYKQKWGAAFHAAILLLISLLCFSFNQQSRWLHGFNMCIPLANTMAIAGFAWLRPASFRWKFLTISALCGVVSTFSFSVGLAFWPSALVLLLDMGSSLRLTACG